MDRHWLFRGTVLILLVMVGWWVLDEDPAPPRGLDPALKLERRPDYFMDDFTVLATDGTGTPAWELAAPRMVHFIDDDTWELERPDMLYYVETGQPWRMTAERGRAWSGLDHAKLEGEVHFTREAGEDHPAARLDTSQVRLRPNLRQADTDEFAVYRSAGQYMEGIGAHGDFARDILELHSEVKATYAPPES